MVTARQDDGTKDAEDRIAYFCPTCQPGPHPELPPRTRRGRRPQQQSGRRARYG